MTAKELLRERIEKLTEEEAAQALRLLDREADPLTALLDDAPLDDEPTSPQEVEMVSDTAYETPGLVKAKV